MAEGHNAGDQTSPSHRPTPTPRKQSGSGHQTQPALPVKRSAVRDRDIDTRLGIVRQSSFPITPPSPLPSPPRSAAVAGDGDAVQSESKGTLYVNDKAGNGNESTEPSTLSTIEPNVIGRTETLEMRSKVFEFPASAEASGTQGYRTSRFSNAARVSAFISAAEKSAKSEKTGSVPRPGRLAVPDEVKGRIALVLSQQQRRATLQVEDRHDVGIDITGGEMSGALSKRSATSPGPRKSPQSHYAWMDDDNRNTGYAAASSDDALSSGGEFYDNDNFEFMRPSEEVMLKSIPIVPTQQQTVKERKGYVFKFIGQKGTLGPQWQKRWLTVDSDSLRYYSNNKSCVSKRMIPVSTMVNVWQEVKTNDVHPYRFRLKTIDRVYRYAVDTSDDLAWWTNLLMHAIIGAQGIGFKPGGDMREPCIEGFAKIDVVHRKCYMAIKKGKFCFYNTKHDFNSYCPIHQVDLQLASVKDVGRCKLQLQTPQVLFTLLFETQEELNAWKSAFEEEISYALGDNKVLDEVYKNSSNHCCADCRASGPEWAAVNMAITVCKNCAGVHRTMENAKIRSLRMDSKVWTQPLIKLMTVIGNENANKLWEWSIQSDDLIDADADDSERTQFINAKYREKRFCCLHQQRGSQSALNELLCTSVQHSDVLQTMQLVFSGADVTCVSRSSDSEGSTALQLAEATHQPLQMEFLLLNGADVDNKLSQIKTDMTSETKVGSTISFSGYLYKTGPQAKSSFNKRWCVLRSGSLSYHKTDKTAEAKSAVNCGDMISIAAAHDDRMRFAFELGTSRQSARSYLFAAETSEDRQQWMTMLAKCMSPVTLESAVGVKCMSRGGVVFVRLSLTHDWSRCWVHLCEKVLHICMTLKGTESWEEIDLRKAASITYLKAADRCIDSFDNGPPIFIDLHSQRLVYIHGDNNKETEAWFNVLNKAVEETSNNLSSQPLTEDDVPVVVDKLINFVTDNGLTTEGIYRLCGQQSVITRLLNSLSTGSGARTICLRTDEYQLHDITSALKRFLRNLDDPLLTQNLSPRWMQAAGVVDFDTKLQQYKKLLLELDPVNYWTLRRLILHLAQVADASAENKMNVSNLATTFGPVLFNSDADGGSSLSAEICVVQDLLQNHRELFHVRNTILERGRRLLAEQHKLHDMAVNDKSPFLVQVYVGGRDGKVVSIPLQTSSALTAGELLREAVRQVGSNDVDDWFLEEVVCDEELERPVHCDENVAEILTRWSYWPDEFCHNNYLVMKPYSLIHDVFKALNDTSAALCSELKYAYSKSFKKYLFEFNKNCLSYRKDKSSDVVLKWYVTDMIIYVGIPLKRPTHNPRCGFTFISTKESLVSPFFGHSVLCGSDKEVNRWLALLYFAQHGDNLWSYLQYTSQVTQC